MKLHHRNFEFRFFSFVGNNRLLRIRIRQIGDEKFRLFVVVAARRHKLDGWMNGENANGRAVIE